MHMQTCAQESHVPARCLCLYGECLLAHSCQRDVKISSSSPIFDGSTCCFHEVAAVQSIQHRCSKKQRFNLATIPLVLSFQIAGSSQPAQCVGQLGDKRDFLLSMLDDIAKPQLPNNQFYGW